MDEQRKRGFKDLDPGSTRPFMAVLILFLVRSVLLWILVVPIGSVMWVLGYRHWRKRRVALGQLFGWLDLNLIALLDRAFFWWMKGSPFPHYPFSQIPEIDHKVGMGDFA